MVSLREFVGGDGKFLEEFTKENKGKNRPMFWVNYDEALEFCKRLTERERAAGRLPAGYKYTLPTEAQWEYACRAGTTGAYAGSGNLHEMGWLADNSNSATHDVATKKANAWGLYDMHGNVWEWCLDWYGKDYGSGDLTKPVTDPRGATTGGGRVSRGGSWSYAAQDCRSAYRGRGVPAGRNSDLGFRVALSSVELSLD